MRERKRKRDIRKKKSEKNPNIVQCIRIEAKKREPNLEKYQQHATPSQNEEKEEEKLGTEKKRAE